MSKLKSMEDLFGFCRDKDRERENVDMMRIAYAANE